MKNFLQIFLILFIEQIFSVTGSEIPDYSDYDSKSFDEMLKDSLDYVSNNHKLLTESLDFFGNNHNLVTESLDYFGSNHNLVTDSLDYFGNNHNLVTESLDFTTCACSTFSFDSSNNNNNNNNLVTTKAISPTQNVDVTPQNDSDDEDLIIGKWTRDSWIFYYHEAVQVLRVQILLKLYYNLSGNESFYTTAASFILACDEIKYKEYDPSIVFESDEMKETFLDMNIDVSSSEFKAFYEHVKNNTMPITSPLYRGAALTKFEIWKAKRELIIKEFVEPSIRDKIDEMNVEALVRELAQDFPQFEYFETVIDVVKEEISGFLLADKSDELDYCKALIEVIWNVIGFAIENLEHDQHDRHELSKAIYDQFDALFFPVLDVILNYRSVKCFKEKPHKDYPIF